MPHSRFAEGEVRRHWHDETRGGRGDVSLFDRGEVAEHRRNSAEICGHSASLTQQLIAVVARVTRGVRQEAATTVSATVAERVGRLGSDAKRCRQADIVGAARRASNAGHAGNSANDGRQTADDQ